jgi:SAM-dependent methyltransferase
MTTNEHWEKIAHRWNQVGSPLRPAEDDLRHFMEFLDITRSAPFRSLILGVTPELYKLPWPSGSTILAVDRSPEMIASIWPGPAEAALEANWLDLTFPNATFDAVLCDGGLHLQGYPEDHSSLADSVSRVLLDGGCFVIRLFTLPPEPETPRDVWRDLKQRKIANFHEFKLRMAMALQITPAHGVVLGEVYNAILNHLDGRLQSLTDQTGWPLEQVETLESYRDSSNAYRFLSEADSVEALTASGQLVLTGRRFGRYPLSERCSLLQFRKLGRCDGIR